MTDQERVITNHFRRSTELDTWSNLVETLDDSEVFGPFDDLSEWLSRMNTAVTNVKTAADNLLSEVNPGASIPSVGADDEIVDAINALNSDNGSTTTSAVQDLRDHLDNNTAFGGDAQNDRLADLFVYCTNNTT